MQPKLTTTALFLLLAQISLAQVNEMVSNTTLHEAGNKNLNYKTKYDNIGSPYFLEGYQEAELTTTEGVYKNVKVKVNLESNEVLFISDEGKELVTTMPVWRIRFPVKTGEQSDADKILIGVGKKPLNTAGASIYQLLESGACSLLKQVKATHADKQEQFKAAITRTYQQTETYYTLIQGGSPQKIKPGKDGLVNLFKDKKAAIANFIDENKLECQSEADYTKVVKYYNSLYQSSVIKSL